MGYFSVLFRSHTFAPGYRVYKLAYTLFQLSLQDATHQARDPQHRVKMHSANLNSEPLPDSTLSLTRGTDGAFGLTKAKHTSFCNDWVRQSALPIKKSLTIFKDSVKRMHISAHRAPFQVLKAHEASTSRDRKRPLTAPMSFISHSGQLTLETGNWKHTCLQLQLLERAGAWGQASVQPEEEGELLHPSFFHIKSTASSFER